MLAKLLTHALFGIDARPVDVEVDISPAAMPKTVLVGLAEAAQPGTGLKNLRERLAAFYGPGAVLRLGAATPQGLHVELCMPAAALSP